MAEEDADQSILATSNDGGGSWFQSVLEIPRTGYQLRGLIGPVDGRGANIAMAVRWYAGDVLDHLAIEESHDGGHTFTAATLPAGLPFDKQVVSMASDRDWAIISANRFALTHDGGVHWQVHDAPSNGLVVSRLALTADNSVFCMMTASGRAEAQRIFRSLDDGVTFAEITLPSRP